MNNKQRLDTLMAAKKMVESRSQAESWIKLGRVTVDGKVITKPGFFVDANATIVLSAPEQYVSRAGLKLASVAAALQLDFTDAVVLDVGSSTGGFTDYSLQHGARKVIAVDVGTDQLHQSLRSDPRIELHEKTDIRGFTPSETPDIVVIDVSFVSLRDILPTIYHLLPTISRQPSTTCQIVAMVKPQFEAHRDQITRGGIVKNDRIRRDILKQFEIWTKEYFVINNKADSEVAGANGNRERFYLLHKSSR